MNKNRIILIVGLLSVLLVAMAVSRPFSDITTAMESNGLSANKLSDYYQRQAELNASVSAGTSDFFQRHPEWIALQAAIIPVTGLSEAADYFQRHLELSMPAGITVDVTDYFMRHPAQNAPTATIDLSDYFLRH